MEQFIRIIWGVNEGVTYPLRNDCVFSVGRAQDNHICLENDLRTSGHHANIRLVQNRIMIRDLGSTNGTLINGSKIPPDEWRRPNRFFVFGATVFTMTSKRIGVHPLPVSEAEISWTSHDLFHQANLLSSGFIGSVHIFLALLRLYQPTVSSFLENIGMESRFSELNRKLVSHEIFGDSYLWLNKFLEFSCPEEPLQKVITPLAQTFFEAWSKDQNPISLLEKMTMDDFNLVHLFLDWPNRTSWHDLFLPKEPDSSHDKTMETTEQEVKDVLHYKGLWKAMEPVLARGKVPLITGSRGIGKSYFLRILKPSNMNAILPDAYKDLDFLLKDPWEYLLYHPAKKLGVFNRSLIDNLLKEKFLFVDHVGLLFKEIKEHRGDISGITRGFSKKRCPVVLACSLDELDLVQENIPDCVVFNLDEHLEPFLDQIYDYLIGGVEIETGDVLMEQAKKFIKDKVIKSAPRDLRRLDEFLTICKMRLARLNVRNGEVDSETRAISKINVNFFQKVHNDWFPNQQKPTIQPTIVQPMTDVPAPSVKGVDHSKEIETLINIEEHLRNFSEALVKIPLRYGPISGSFNDPGPISREQKMDMMVLHLMKVMKSLKGGFKAWFDAFWDPIRPMTLIGQHGKKEKILWRAFEEKAKYINFEREEQEMRQRCQENWDKW